MRSAFVLSFLAILIFVLPADAQRLTPAERAQALTSPTTQLPMPAGTGTLILAAPHVGAAPLGITHAEDDGGTNPEEIYAVDLFSGNTFTYDVSLANTGMLASPGGVNTMTGIAWNPITNTVFAYDATAATLYECDRDLGIINSFPLASTFGGLIGGASHDNGANSLWFNDIGGDTYFETDLTAVATGTSFANPRDIPPGTGAFGNGISHVDDTDCFDLPCGALAAGQVDELVRFDAAGGTEIAAGSVTFAGDTFINGNVWDADGSGAGMGPVNYLVGNATNQLFEVTTFDTCFSCSAVDGLTCDDDDVDVTLTWTNPEAFTGIEILRDGASIAMLPGGDTSFLDVAPGSGMFSYTVVSTCPNTGTGSASCSAFVGAATQDLVWDGSASGNTGLSRTAIEDELTNQGRTFTSVTTIDGLILSDYETVWAIAGAYPDNHVISAGEGQQLADYAVGGGPTGTAAALYIEGTDYAAFDAPSPINDLDHTEGLADGGTIGSVIGQPAIDQTGASLCLDLTAIGTAAYTEVSNQFVDHLSPDASAEGVGVFLMSDVGAIAGVYGDASLSGVGAGVHKTIVAAPSVGSYDGVQSIAIAAYVTCLKGAVLPPDDAFIRGDCDGNGLFNGLLDGLMALNFQFVPGSPTPPCLRACDADGNRLFNGLIDGLRILNVQFTPGTPLPPPPYPNCGEDPNITVSCDIPPAACN